MQMVEEKMEQLKATHVKSSLPDRPDIQMAEDILVRIRTSFYQAIKISLTKYSAIKSGLKYTNLNHFVTRNPLLALA
jgi:hypothetical protein